jgi:RNA polymerase I-specific transcription initiation factor RRN6
MARPVLKDLPYGHFGQALYDQEEKRWVFGRVADRRPKFRILGEWEKVVDGCFDPTPPADIKRTALGPATAKRNPRSGIMHFGRLSEVHSSLSGLESLVYPDLISSWAVASSLSVYDPSAGDLLAEGKVPIALRTFQRASSVFACPGGESGGVLRLVETIFKECGIVSQTTSQGAQHYRIAYPTDGDVWVNHQGYTIRQVAFSPQDDRRIRYLAARSVTSTVIYTIGVLAHTSRTRVFRDPAFQVPGLTLERTCKIPLDPMANMGHSDMAFNPWVPGEVAVIDHRGKWFIYNVQESPEEFEELERIDPLHYGSLSQTTTAESNSQATHPNPFGEDGWARIFWVFNGEYLLVCKRQICQLVDLASGQSLDISLEPDHENWNLDVRPGVESKDNLFILTNRKLFWLQLAAGQSGEPDDFGIGYQILFSVRHFRDPKDMTVKIRLLELDGGMSLSSC